MWGVFSTLLWLNFWVVEDPWRLRRLTVQLLIPATWVRFRCHSPSPYSNIILEVLARYGSREQQQKWLVPLLNGEIRSAFAMTERFGTCLSSIHSQFNSNHLRTVASSDATNIRTSIRQEGNEIVINGHKWYVHLQGISINLKAHLSQGGLAALGTHARAFIL